MNLGLLAAAGTLTIIPGAIVIYFVKKLHCKRICYGKSMIIIPIKKVLLLGSWGDVARKSRKRFF